MEFLDELNEDGTKTGRQVPRDYAHGHGVLHATSQIYIYRYRNGRLEILLQRRSENKDSFPGKLDISCAGHVSAGLSYDEAAIKELSEELGLSVNSDSLKKIGVFRTSKKAEFYGRPFLDEQLSAVYITELYVEATDISFQKEEISEVVWMRADEISERLKRGSEEFCINYERFLKVLSAIRQNVEILFSDDELTVCIKPAGVPSQADLSGEEDMLSILEERLNSPIYLVHRLDRNTGGVMVFAKTKTAAALLSETIADKKKFTKNYLAVTEGAAPVIGCYDNFLYKHQNKAYITDKKKSGAKKAKLSFNTLSHTNVNGRDYSLVSVKLETGRFHQIRAQFASAGLPLCGDGKYGGRDNKCIAALWANSLSFPHPVTGESLHFEKEPPCIYPWNIFKKFIKKA